MDFAASGPQGMNHFETSGLDGQRQLQWTPDQFLHQDSHPSEPFTIPEDPLEPISLEQISELLSAYESTWQSSSSTISFNPENSTPNFTHPAWTMSSGEEASVASIDHHYENQKSNFPFIPIPSNSSTVYRNGFGNPLNLAEYPCEMGSFDCGSSPPPLSTTSDSSSEIHYSAYGYPMSRPSSALEPSNQWSYGSPNEIVNPNPATFNTGCSKISAPLQPIKKHRCQICGRAFQRQTTLTQHQITHTGERPYACPVSGCGKAFTTASNAKRHAKTHYRISNTYHA